MQPEWTQNEEEVLTALDGNRVARLVRTSDGPKLLINLEEYALKESCWDVEMFHGRNSSMLIFYWKGEVKLSVKFGPLSHLFDLHRHSVSATASDSASGFGWSQVEAFLVKLYECLTFKSRVVPTI